MARMSFYYVIPACLTPNCIRSNMIKYRMTVLCFVNLLEPTGYGTHEQFNIQQVYVLPTLYLCVLYLSEDKQRLVPLTA